MSAYAYKGKDPIQATPERETPKCGTNAGYRVHMDIRTTACQGCKDAHAAYCRAWRRRPRRHSACGTYAGYMRHKRAEGDACEACLTAYADYMHQYRANRKAAA